MTAARPHDAARAVILRRQGLSHGLIAWRLGTRPGVIVLWIRRHAPELIGNVVTKHSIDREHGGCVDGFDQFRAGRRVSRPPAITGIAGQLQGEEEGP